MKTYLFIFFLLLGVTSIGQQNNVGIWKIGGDFSPEIGLFNPKNEIEDFTPMLTFTAKVSLEVQFTSRITIRTGIHSTARAMKTSTGNGPYGGVYRKKFHYIGIPMEFQFTVFNKGKVKMFASIGTGINFIYLKTYRGQMNNSSGGGSGVRLILKSRYHTNFNPSGIASIGIDVKIKEDLCLRLEPIFRFSSRVLFKEIYVSETSVYTTPNKYYFNSGFNVGFIHSI